MKKYHRDDFSSYSPEEKGIDSFFDGHIGEKPEYAELWGTVKEMLILFHGQSCVERGFSDNKDILKNNMADETLISYHRAHDGIKNQDGPLEESVTKELLDSCRRAHARNQSHLDQQKKSKQTSEKEK